MNYYTVFEITDKGFGNILFAFSGIAFIIIWFLFVKTMNYLFRKKPNIIFSICVLVFSILWTITALEHIVSSRLKYRKAYKDGSFKVVEGFVENFVPMPSYGNKLEKFSVDGVNFKYSDYQLSPGFNNSASNGGPIKKGLPVRISYINNVILKL